MKNHACLPIAAPYLSTVAPSQQNTFLWKTRPGTEFPIDMPVNKAQYLGLVSPITQMVGAVLGQALALQIKGQNFQRRKLLHGNQEESCEEEKALTRRVELALDQGFKPLERSTS
jgi:hypothetical protein